MDEAPRVLVVDDDEEIREFLCSFLKRRGYSVDQAYNAREALTKMKRSRFRLVLADIKMPGMDGLDLLRRIKEISEDTAVIMMTAYCSLTYAMQAVSYGACDYLTKPFTIEEAWAAVERGCGYNKMTDTLVRGEPGEI